MRSRALVAIAVFLAPWLLSRPARADDYLGAERCGQCHELEYEQWKKSGHATALARLSALQQKDQACRSCHTTAPAADSPVYSGVQCESCHGAGNYYAPSHIMRDKPLAELYGLEPVSESSCKVCHAGDGPSSKPFDYKTMLRLVLHKEPKQK